jgi:hypothetical protein
MSAEALTTAEALTPAGPTPSAEHYLAMNAPRMLVNSRVTKQSYLIADTPSRRFFAGMPNRSFLAGTPNRNFLAGTFDRNFIADASDHAADRKDGFMEPPKFTDEQLQRMMELRDEHRIATASQHAELAALSHKLSLLLTADSLDRKEISSIQAKIDSLRSELGKVNAKFAVDSAEILTPDQRQKLRHRLLLHQGRPGFGPGHGPGPIPGFYGDVMFGMPPMAGAVTHTQFDAPLPPPVGGCEGFFTEICPAPFTIPLGPPPMFTFGMMRGGPGHMVVPPPGAPRGGHAGPEGGGIQMGSPRRPPAPPPAPPSESRADEDEDSPKDS